MRYLLALGVVLQNAIAFAGSAPPKLWTDLKSKRDAIPGVIQQFEVTRTYRWESGGYSTSQRVTVQASGRKWREQADSRIRVFDGSDLYSLEEGSQEYVREKRRDGNDSPAPAPHLDLAADWSKVVEVKRKSCGLSDADHPCVLLEVPLNGWFRGSPVRPVRLKKGAAQLLVDLQTGLPLALRVVEVIQTWAEAYEQITSYGLRGIAYGPMDPKLFALPAEAGREVKSFAPWTAARIRKELAGKPAPAFRVTDVSGKEVALADLKGKIVLLDFWATWCPPCRADAPALEKLYAKYGARDLMIIGFSVGEAHATVNRFLALHPRSFPTALTTENDLPRPYHLEHLPTYVVIDRSGAVSAAVSGDQGFSELRRILHSAGLDID